MVLSFPGCHIINLIYYVGFLDLLPPYKRISARKEWCSQDLRAEKVPLPPQLAKRPAPYPLVYRIKHLKRMILHP
jgi:hypothetical protein